MRFKFKIHCYHCNCDFFITRKYNISPAMECPNCKTKIPDSYALEINNCVKALNELSDIYPNDNSDGDDAYWSVFGKKDFSVELVNTEWED